MDIVFLQSEHFVFGEWTLILVDILQKKDCFFYLYLDNKMLSKKQNTEIIANKKELNDFIGIMKRNMVDLEVINMMYNTIQQLLGSTSLIKS